MWGFVGVVVMGMVASAVRDPPTIASVGSAIEVDADDFVVNVGPSTFSLVDDHAALVDMKVPLPLAA